MLIDDMDPYHPDLARDFKIWADKYTFIGDVKGSSVEVNLKRIFVTSQYRIADCFKDPKTVEALVRRFKEIVVPD